MCAEISATWVESGERKAFEPFDFGLTWDPAFDQAGLFAALSPVPAPVQTFRGARSTCGDFRSLRFGPLPASAREVGQITSFWKTSHGGDSERQIGTGRASEETEGAVLSLLGTAATETEFKHGASGRRVLHLATHGFFLGDNCSSDGGSDPVSAENPLLRAGLALAGANHRDTAGPEEDDGILTAEEIAALDLSSVEWAVLSACDTGVGEIKTGEGVFGFRRAFQTAGVKTLIMSLWPVEEESTRQWMTALYRNRFLRSLGTAESVREASLELLSERRANDLSTHPFFWAGFVAAGDWK